MTEQWILTEDPLPEGERLESIDIFSEEAALTPDLPAQRVVEGRLTLGRQRIGLLLPSSSVGSGSDREPERSEELLYLIWAPFTLHLPPGNKLYEEVRLHVDLFDETVSAISLFPDNVSHKEEVEELYTLSPQFNFVGVEASLVSAGFTVKFERLRPIVRAFGVGENYFYWVYSDATGEGVLPGTKHALIVLSVPSGRRSMAGRIRYCVTLRKKTFGKWLKKQSRTDDYDFVWQLAKSPTITGLWPQ